MVLHSHSSPTACCATSSWEGADRRSRKALLLDCSNIAKRNGQPPAAQVPASVAKLQRINRVRRGTPDPSLPKMALGPQVFQAHSKAGNSGHLLSFRHRYRARSPHRTPVESGTDDIESLDLAATIGDLDYNCDWLRYQSGKKHQINTPLSQPFKYGVSPKTAVSSPFSTRY